MTAEELPPVNMAANFAVQTVQLQHMRESLERIELAMGSHVTRNEWEMRNGYVDGQFKLLTLDDANARSALQDMAKAIEAKRAPWWAVASVIVGGGSLAWLIFGPAIIALP
jgi:hypothetical protein